MSFNFPIADDEAGQVSAASPEWLGNLDFLWLIAELHAELSEQKRLGLSI